MTQKLKRYGFRIGKPECGNVETILPVEDHLGKYVKYEDILPLIEVLKFYDSNDIRSINFDYTDNGEKARQALASVGVE